MTNRNATFAAAGLLALLPAAFVLSSRAIGPEVRRQEADQVALVSDTAFAKEAREVRGRLRSSHYLHDPADGGLSALILRQYVDLLDPARELFLASDLTSFELYEESLADALESGDLSPAFEIFERYRERLRERNAWFTGAIRGDLDALDLNDGETLVLDRSHATWPATEGERADLWRLSFEADVLSLKLANREPDEIRSTLERRYQSRARLSERVHDDDVVQVFFNALARCYDPHTRYLGRKSAEDFDIDMSLSVEGIGALLGNTGEYVQIERIIPGGPAEKDGRLAPTDRILEVGQGEDGEMVDVVGWRTDEVAGVVRGPKGSKVRLSILPADQPEGSPPREVVIERDEVKLEERAAKSFTVEVQHGPKTVKVGVIHLPDFYMDFEAYRRGDKDFRSTMRDVKRLLEQLKKEDVAGIVLDLRGNGGGSLVEVVELGGLFLGKVPIVQVRDVDGTVDTLTAHTQKVYDGPLAVMTDRLSASASEIFAGAIQDYGRGLIVGEATFGKGTVQGILPLEEGDLLLTQAKFYRVSGASTQLRGVEPDVRLVDGWDPDTIGEAALDKALPWDEIKPVRKLRTDESLRAFLPELRRRSAKRIASEPELRRHVERREYFEGLAERDTLSLDEGVRRKEQAEHEARLVEIENRYRKAVGEEPIEGLADLPEESREDRESIDPYQRETARLVVDLIDLRSKVR